MIDTSLLNSVEIDAMEKLRKRVENVMPPDLLDDQILYYRFLKARNFDLDKAEKMLRKSILWRKHHQSSTLIENFKPKDYFVKFVEPRFIGYDKEGDIVMYCPFGTLDARDVLKCVKMNDYEKHCIWFAEKWRETVKQRGEKGEMKNQQFVTFVDLDGLTFANASSKATSETLLLFLHIAQDNYPETIKRLNVINAPTYYMIAYSLIKPFMSLPFQQKVHIYGRTDGWKEKILEAIDAEILPAFMGGKRTDSDGDPLCRTFLSHGGWMPESYYLTDEERGFKHKSRVTKITVHPASREDVYLDVMDKGSVIQWEFLVKYNDIGFGLFFQGSDNIEEILPVLKYHTADGVETSSYKAELAGKYIISFDNSHSWFTSKNVEYCITVLKTEL